MRHLAHFGRQVLFLILLTTIFAGISFWGASITSSEGLALEAHPIMDSPAGKVPFFIFTQAFTTLAHDRGIVLVRAEPPFDELAVFDDVVGQRAGAVYMSKDDRFVYLLTGTPYVIQISTSTYELRKIYTPGAYNGMALSPDDRFLYVADYENGTVYKLDVATGQVLKEIEFGRFEQRSEGTYGINVEGPSGGGSGPGCVSPDGRYWYLTPESTNPDHPLYGASIFIWKFDLWTDKIIGNVDTTEPRGAHMSCMISADGKYLYTGNFGGKSITQINTQTMSLVEVYKDSTFTNWHAIHPFPNGESWFTPLDQGESGYLALFNVGEGISNNLVGYVGPMPRAMDSPSQRVVHMIEFTPDGKYAIYDNMYEEEIYLLDVETMGIAKTLKIGGAYEGKAPRHDWFGADHPMLTPDGKYVGVAVVYDSTYEIYDVMTGERVYKGSVGLGEEGSTSHYTLMWAPGYQYGTMLGSRRQPGRTPSNAITLRATQSNLIPPDQMK